MRNTDHRSLRIFPQANGDLQFHDAATGALVVTLTPRDRAYGEASDVRLVPIRRRWSWHIVAWFARRWRAITTAAWVVAPFAMAAVVIWACVAVVNVWLPPPTPSRHVVEIPFPSSPDPVSAHEPWSELLTPKALTHAHR